jgi:hypothetical protein
MVQLLLVATVVAIARASLEFDNEDTLLFANPIEAPATSWTFWFGLSFLGVFSATWLYSTIKQKTKANEGVREPLLQDCSKPSQLKPYLRRSSTLSLRTEPCTPTTMDPTRLKIGEASVSKLVLAL